MSDPFKDALRKAGECLRPTPEIDAEAYETDRGDMVVSVNLARQICFQRDEARELLTSEKATRNAIIANGIETGRQLAEARQAFAIATSQLVQAQGELRQAREENARLQEAIKRLADLDFGSQGWDEQCNRAAAVLRNLVTP